MIAVDLNAQRDWLMVVQIVVAENELCFVQKDYLHFGFVEFSGAQICLWWVVGQSDLWFDRMDCFEVAGGHLAVRIC